MEVLVVGGGLAGLTAAAFAARGGAKVTLFEKAHEPGGRAQTNDVQGFLLNRGPHALYRGGHAMRTLRALGIEPKGQRPSYGRGLALYGDALHELPTGGAALFRTTLLDKRGKLELAARLASLPLQDRAKLRDVSVSSWMRERFSNERAAQAFGAIVRVATYGADHERMSAGAAIEQVLIATKHDVMYLDGGWAQLVTGLKEIAVRNGARIVTGAHVDKVESGGIRLRSGERLEGEVILAVTPHAVRELTGVDLPVRPIRAASLDVALRSLPKNGNRFLLGVDAPLYYSVHSIVAKLAPEGGAVLHVARYLVDEKPEQEELEGVLDLVQPGWREVVAHRRFLPSMTVTNALVEAGRARPSIDAIPGVLLAGDWIGEEGMLADTAFASGRRAAEVAIRRRMAA